MRFSKLFRSAVIFRRGVGLCNKTVRYLNNASDQNQPNGCGSNTTEMNKEDKIPDGDKKGVVLGVYENDKELELTPAAEEVNQRSGGKLSRYLNDLSCQLKLGKAFVVTDVDPQLGDVALASFGRKDAGYNKLEELEEDRENVRWGVGAGVSELRRRGCSQLLVDPSAAPDAAAEAAELAAWRFQEFKMSSCLQTAPSVSMYNVQKYEASPSDSQQSAEMASEPSAQLWTKGAIMGCAQNWARYLSDMPANKMTPVDVAQAALDVLCPLGVQVWARERHWMEAQRMEAFLTVARGSCEPPVFLELAYTGSSQDLPPILLAAKGVTFDCGGLCLKHPDHMRENRGSMAGAAVVLAAIKAIAELKASFFFIKFVYEHLPCSGGVPINVRAVIPLCENLISGQCMKVGDVVRALNGTTIQIEDTDMEGRLMLADALVYGQAMYRPTLVVDVATLTRGYSYYVHVTRGILLATGGGAYGCFSSGEEAWGALRAAGAAAGDRPWRLPLWNYFRNQLIDDPSVDLRNKGSGTATPCIGAAFLKQQFVCGDWLHLDVTGVGKLAHAAAPPYLRPERMSGRPTRALAYFLERLNHASTTYPTHQYTQPRKTNSRGEHKLACSTH
ncbi:unnamed protein product [Parnassius apollo]|uniref:Cytosol aminopeptidase n=1 Tax=Parnassius apollo TaxID=110799 RepID=A0A8S3Y8R6_PARAO|nr:unnamed protein product [Parnassius apollo]